MKALYLVVPLVPLAASVVVGLFGRRLGRTLSHWLCIGGVAIAFAASLAIAREVAGGHTFNGDLYTWAQVGGVRFAVGFLIDPLTVTMMLVVTFVSLMVHVYTIGYMAEDPGYTRFFSYISLFTFAMLMLVMSNNFLQLFFGWEAVGLVSYLLIGFWYTRPSAIHANLKAFLVNRVGDFGFVLGIGLVVAHFGTLDYAEVFGRAGTLADATLAPWDGGTWSLMTAICIGLFVGAMGKSAQVPLHVWLPDSMEGPTPISALIHAATMVTAGIFMVARMSPLFELSETALAFVTVIGATTALFMAFLGIVQNDIKRVVAYSTLSQLGYMTVALGVSAYSAAIFHLMTHAFFKALLFLAAGSVIIAMHHEQDLRRMGGLRKCDADHLGNRADRLARPRRHPALRGVLLEGRDHRGGAPLQDPRQRLRLLRGAGRRVHHGVLLVPDAVPRVPRQAEVERPAGPRPRTRRRPTITTRRTRRGTSRMPTTTTAGRRARAPGWSPRRWSCSRSPRSSRDGPTSSRCSSATTSARRSSCGPSTRCSGSSRTSGTASPHSSSTA